MRAGQQSEMHIAHHSEEQTPVPPGLWPCPTCFLHLTGTDGSWPGVGGERVCTGGSPRGQLTASQERWTAEGGREGGCLAVLQAQNHKLGRLQGQSVQSLGSGRLRWDH